MILAQNAEDRQKQVKVTTNFLSQQLEEAKQSLDAQRRKTRSSSERQYLGSYQRKSTTNLSNPEWG